MSIAVLSLSLYTAFGNLPLRRTESNHPFACYPFPFLLWLTNTSFSVHVGPEGFSASYFLVIGGIVNMTQVLTMSDRDSTSMWKFVRIPSYLIHQSKEVFCTLSCLSCALVRLPFGAIH